MQTITQSPTDPGFVQNPYPFYARARAMGNLVYWQDYAMAAATSHAAVNAILKDRRMGREAPDGFKPDIPASLCPFYDVEAHSMLEAEPPRHTRLRGAVLRAFTGRRISQLEPQITALCHQLIDAFPPGRCNLLATYAQRLPVIIIARFLGLPETMADDLLRWSNAMVGMYQARRTPQDEARAIQATQEFTAFLRDFIAHRRKTPGDDLITHLIGLNTDGETLSEDEVISTAILLLNAGHEATVHSIGNAVKTLLEHGRSVSADTALANTEESLRYDPPLHMFTRWVYEDLTIFGQDFRKGDQIACLLASANRDAQAFDNPDIFDPSRELKLHNSFGAGIHFCVGAPLARLELRLALPILFERCPSLALADKPHYADVYHFHGLSQLDVTHDASPQPEADENAR